MPPYQITSDYPWDLRLDYDKTSAWYMQYRYYYAVHCWVLGQKTDPESTLPLPAKFKQKLEDDLKEAGVDPVAQLPDGVVLCPACLGEHVLPVRHCTEEAHVFCATCLLAFLNVQCLSEARCPACWESELIQSPEGGTVDHHEWRARISKAKDISGLLAEDEAFHATELDTFGLGKLSQGAIMHGTTVALNYIQNLQDVTPQGYTHLRFWDGEVHVVQGQGLINEATLMPKLVAMAHLIPAMAEADGRPWTSRLLHEWHMVVEFLVGFLRHRMRRKFKRVHQTAKFPESFFILMIDDSAMPDHLLETPFLNPILADGTLNGYHWQFKELLKFVAWITWNEKREHDLAEKAKLEKERREAIVKKKRHGVIFDIPRFTSKVPKFMGTKEGLMRALLSAPEMKKMFRLSRIPRWVDLMKGRGRSGGEKVESLERRKTIAGGSSGITQSSRLPLPQRPKFKKSHTG